MRFSLLLAALLALTAPAAAQVDCPGCVLGIWDHQDILSANRFGTMSIGVLKSVYVGVCLAPGETGISGAEFSVQGLDGLFIAGFGAVTPATLLLGSVAAPANETGTGGVNIGWANCLSGSRALVKIDLLTFSPVVNRVLRVTHKYPPSNANYNLQPVVTRCDDPQFTAVRVTGGCYILNGDGFPAPSCYPFGSACTVGLSRSTWTQVKALYRD